MVLFGGNNGTASFNSVSVLDTAEWKWSHPIVTGKEPRPRTGHTASLVPARRGGPGGDEKQGGSGACGLQCTAAVVIFGGWDPELASTRNKRRKKSGHSPAASSGTPVAGGGCQEEATSAYFNDLFVLDTGRWFWSELSLPGPLPSVRTGHSAVFDAPRQRLLVFGGQRLTDDGRDVAFLDDLCAIGPLRITLAE